MTLVDIPTGDFVTTTLNGAISAGATTMTIGTGLAIPATNGILQIDYDSSSAVGASNGPETIYYTSYTTGTGAVSGMTRGYDANTSGVAHANGASIQAGPSVAHLTYPKNIYCFRANDSGGTTLTDNTITQINLATEEYDYNSNFASSAYTAPLAGVYHFDGALAINGSTANMVTFINYIYVNGSEVIRANRTNENVASPGISISADLLLAAGDIVTYRALQDSDGNEATVTGSVQTYFSGHLVHAV